MTIVDPNRTPAARAINLWTDARERDARIANMMDNSHRDRQRAVRLLRDAGMSLRDAGAVLGVSHTTIAKYDVPPS